MRELRWDGRTSRISACPVCGVSGGKRRVLEVVARDAAPADGVTALLECPDCAARYAEPLRSARYEEVDRDGLKFYLEQGAGIRTMLEPLLLLDSRPIRHYLEIGCSFGFVIDYARRVLGWEVRGFDPGFIAAAGARQLELPIENAYFAGIAPGGTRADLLFCSEVIEHIAEPSAFLALLRGALDEHGLLLLTTPNGDALSPKLAPELLLPLLSPGQHAILYGRRAMTVLLRQAGFDHIRIDDSGHQMRVAASIVPFAGTSSHFSADLYRRYLTEAAAEHDPAEPLGAGLACRLLKEEVNNCGYGEARVQYLRLRDGYLRRYGFDIESIEIDELPSLSGTDFTELSGNWPCNLTAIWHCRGLIELQENEPGRAAGFFAAAMRFGAALRQRLRGIGTDDAETALLCREAEIARLHALARCDPLRAVAEFESLNPGRTAPEEANSPEHVARARRVLFGDLVRTGHYALAERVLGEGDLPLGGGADFDGLAADFAGGLYLLNHAADYSGAAGLFGRLRENAIRALAASGAAEETRRLFREAELAWLTALARSDAPAIAAAYQEVSENRARLDPGAYRPHRSRAFSRVFSDLVNLGHYDVAEQILRCWPEDERELGEAAGSEGFAWGLYLLNRKADYPAAAAVFAKVWQQARDNPADAALLWSARFHQGLASRYQGDTRTADLIAAEIDAGASAARPAPEELRARLGELSPPAS